MAGITIRDLPGDFSFGAAVDGVSWDNIHDEELRARLNALFEERGLIVFENMEPSSKMHLELSRVFGPIKDHPTKTVPRAAEEEDVGVIDLYRTPDETNEEFHGVPIVNGEPRQSFLPWHFDHTYNDELNLAGVLRCVIKPPENGRTGFADGIQIYADFDPELRARAEQHHAIYTLDTRLTQMRFGRTFEVKGDTPAMVATVQEAASFPRALHPMVWTRPDGQKVMHVSGFSAVGIENHEDAEGEALFEDICQEVNRKAKGYWHDWKPTDMVIWDNRRVLHAVEGAHPKYERRMQRTTIRGDYGLGRFEGGKKIGEVDREIAPLDLLE